MENNIETIEYYENLREDFILCCIRIKYIKSTLEIIEAYINHYKFGIIQIENGIKEIHKWESEDQSQDSTYLTRRYTITLLNGITNDMLFENEFIESVIEFVKNSKINKENQKDLVQILNSIRQY